MLNSKEQQNAVNSISTSVAANLENNGNATATSNFVSMAAAQQQNLVNASGNPGSL